MDDAEVALGAVLTAATGCAPWSHAFLAELLLQPDAEAGDFWVRARVVHALDAAARDPAALLGEDPRAYARSDPEHAPEAPSRALGSLRTQQMFIHLKLSIKSLVTRDRFDTAATSKS